MSVQDKEINSFSSNRALIIAGRLLLIAALLASLILILAQESVYSAFTADAGGLAAEGKRVGAQAVAGGDADENNEGENDAELPIVAVVVVNPIRPDMQAAGKMIDVVSSVLTFLGGAESQIIESPIADSPIAEPPLTKLPISERIIAEPPMLYGEDAWLSPNGEALNVLFSTLYDFSSAVAGAHQARLDARADSISYARQLAAAKYLSQSAYQIELSARQAFIDEYGMSAADMNDSDISKLFKNDYFQDRLKELGFYKEDKYGADVNRRNAIIRAQSAFNIPITAKIDLNTKRALINGSDFVPKDTFTGGHPDGMWVVIDKSARILTVYIDDVVFKKYPVAVGATIALTPEGHFTFVSKAVNPRWGGGGYASPIAGGAPNNPLGKRWMGLSKGGGGQYGVHGNVSPYSIGTNASHGCVRMINSDVEELYEYIKIGTPVWIGTTVKLAEWGIYQQLGSWTPDPPNYLDYFPQQALYDE